ncbi:MAG: tetratricopeptide repeat protein, partial [Deltaproteobacteria bacterium]|nr:tetratricopeptide repeat protein [Deltaproteobacteria bacterium]
LDYLHTRGLIHGDLKPQNILVTQEKDQDKIILLDFGLAQSFKTPNTQMIGGTLAYLAPESLLGHLSPQGDLYALGILSLELLSRLKPHQWNDTTQNPFTIIQKNHPKLAKSLEGILKKLSHQEIEERYSRSIFFLKALQRSVDFSIQLNPVEKEEIWTWSSQVIGREHLLKTSLKSLQKKSGSLFIVTGQSGVGKSRFIKAFKNASQLQGKTFLSTDSLPDLFQQLKIKLPKKQNATEKNLLSSWTQNLKKETKDKNLLIQINQLQGWDLQELQWLKHLLSDQSLSHLSWISEYHQEIPLSQDKENFFSELLQEEKTQTLKLKPFTKEQVQAYLQDISGKENIPSNLLENLFKVSGGLPAFLVEILRIFLKDHSLHDLWEAKIENLSQTKIPKNLKEAIEQVFSSISQPSQQILKLLSLSKNPINTRNLQKFFPQHEDLKKDLEKLTQRGLVIQEEESYEIPQGAWIQFLNKQLSSKEEQAWHLKLAQNLEKNSNQNSRELFLLAHHYLKTKQKEKALHYNLAAASLLKSQYLYERSWPFYQASIFLGLKNPQSLLEYSEVAQQVGAIQEALEAFKTILKNPKTPSSLKQKTLRQRASLYQKQGQFKEALQDYKKLLKNPKLKREEKIKLIAQIAMTLYRKGKALEAWDYLQESYFKKAKTEDKEAGILYNILGLLATSRGDLSQASQAYQKAAQSYEEKSDYIGMAHALNNLGITYQQAEKNQMARQVYETCKKLSSQYGQEALLANVENNLAIIKQEEGEYSQALRHYQSCLKIHKKLSMPLEQLGDLLNLANLHLFLGAYPEAKNFLEKTQALSKEHNNVYYQGYIQSLWGDLYLGQEKIKEALSFYKKAQSYFEKAGSDREVKLSLMNQVQALIEKGQSQLANKLFKTIPKASKKDELDYLFYQALLNSQSPNKNHQKEAQKILIKIIAKKPKPELKLKAHYLYQQLAKILNQDHLEEEQAQLAQETLKNLSQSIPEEFHIDFLKKISRPLVFKNSQE